MREENLSPLEATVRSMKEITGALIGVATVLSAVFLPMAFFSGSTGVIYRQFSITIVASMLLSVVVALTVTPAMCASLLRAWPRDRTAARPVRLVQPRLRLDDGAVPRRRRADVARAGKWLVPYAAICAAMGMLLTRLPTGFLPEEDQGVGMVIWTLPAGATLGRTGAVAQHGRAALPRLREEERRVAVHGLGLFLHRRRPERRHGVRRARDWDERPGKDNTAAAISNRATGMLSSVRDAFIFALTPPAIQGLGQSEGFDFELQATAGPERAGSRGARSAARRSPRRTSSSSACAAATSRRRRSSRSISITPRRPRSASRPRTSRAR